LRLTAGPVEVVVGLVVGVDGSVPIGWAVALVLVLLAVGPPTVPLVAGEEEETVWAFAEGAARTRTASAAAAARGKLRTVFMVFSKRLVLVMAGLGYGVTPQLLPAGLANVSQA